jgi:hypothetical protein
MCNAPNRQSACNGQTHVSSKHSSITELNARPFNVSNARNRSNVPNRLNAHKFNKSSAVKPRGLNEWSGWSAVSARNVSSAQEGAIQIVVAALKCAVVANASIMSNPNSPKPTLGLGL